MPSIQDSSKSQPPRFTPRRKGIEVLDEAAEEVVEVGSDFVWEALLLTAAAVEEEGEELRSFDVVSFGVELERIEIGIDGLGIFTDEREVEADEVSMEEEEVVAGTKDDESVGRAKDAVVLSVKKGIEEEVALTNVPFAIAVEFERAVLLRV